jgi:hypothetical protein
MKSRNAMPQLRGAIGTIALMAAFCVAPFGHGFAACSGMMCGPGSSSSSSSGMSGRHGGGGGGMLGVGIGIGAAIGAGAASQPQQPSAPPRGTPPKQRVAKPGPKPEPEPEPEREVCSDADIVPTVKADDWLDIEPRPVPELKSARYPGPKEKYLVFDRNGTMRCIAGPWNLWVYHQLMSLPWPYDKYPVAPTAKKLTAYSIDEVAPEIKPEDGPRFGLTKQQMVNLRNCKDLTKLLVIFRASKPVTIQYHNNPKYMAKPIEFYVTEDGDYTVDRSRARKELPSPLTTNGMHADEAGILQVEHGKPLIIDGKTVYDPQNAVQYQDKEGYMAKPPEYYIAENGDYTADKSRARKVPKPQSTVNMHSDDKGIIQEESGKPLKIDGKVVFSDLDPQNAFEIGPNGTFKQAPTEKPFQDAVNACLGTTLVMHGGEGVYQELLRRLLDGGGFENRGRGG